MAVSPSSRLGPGAVEDEVSGPTVAHGNPANGNGVLEDARSLWHELLGLAQDRFHLAALETRRAGESLVAMVMLGVMAGVLLCAAWLGCEAAAVLWLTEHGSVASSALLLAVMANVLFALVLFGWIRHKSRSLQFPATRRSLQPMPPVSRDAKQP